MHDLKMQDKDKKGFCNLAFTQLKVYKRVAHCCAIFLGHLGTEIDKDIQISISERSSGWAIN